MSVKVWRNAKLATMAKADGGGGVIVRFGDQEVEWHKDFRLYLTTTLPNPHYMPEVCIKVTIINFTVTVEGLEDQLLALVVQKEREDLAKQKTMLVQQNNQFKIQMIGLEDKILADLAAAEGDITEDVELIEGLEETKRISTDINKKSAVAKETQASIKITSEKYKSVADRSSMLFFLMSDLAKIHSYYVYSLAAYTKVFYRGIDLVTEKPEPELDEDGNELPVKVVELNDEELAARCIVLNKSITLTTFNYLRRGLFEKDKLTVATLVTTRILVDNDLLPAEDVSYLFLGKVHPDPGNMGPLHEWMPEALWPKVKALEGLKQFNGLGDAMHSDSDDWLAWVDGATPEVAKFPGDWQKNLSPFDRLILLRALRPDRCSNALAAWIGERVWTRRNTVVLWTLLGAMLFQVLVWVPTTFGQILFVYALMSMFFYGSAAVKFAYLAEVFPTRIRALAMACCGSLAVTMGSAAGPYTVSLAIESWGWHLGYATLVGVPLALAGLLYLTLDSLPSGLEVEDIANRIGKEAQPNHG